MATSILALALLLAACGGGGGGGGRSQVELTINGTLFDTPMTMLPVASTQVLAADRGQQCALATTARDGSFTVTCPPRPDANIPISQLIVQFADGRQNIYYLSVPPEQPTVQVQLFADPVAATSPTPQVTVTPTRSAPAGTAEITEPPDGGTIMCDPPPAVCRFEVRGRASPVLGQPGTRFRVFVSVTPVRPSGGGTFPQFPPVSVDPVTGDWQAEAQIGSEAFQARPGDTFQILVIVTDASLTPGTTANPLRFDRPLDIPGVVHISPFTDLEVGSRQCGLAFAVLLEPPDAVCQGLTVTFRWRIDNRCAGVTYCSDLITDKGQNPFDGAFEDLFPAGQATALQVPLDPRIYDPADFAWGVRVTACQTLGALCENRDPPCAGQAFESNIPDSIGFRGS